MHGYDGRVPSVVDDKWCGVKQFRHRASADRLLAILNEKE